jgi:hypothetical protein
MSTRGSNDSIETGPPPPRALPPDLGRRGQGRRCGDEDNDQDEDEDEDDDDDNVDRIAAMRLLRV